MKLPSKTTVVSLRIDNRVLAAFIRDLSKHVLISSRSQVIKYVINGAYQSIINSRRVEPIESYEEAAKIISLISGAGFEYQVQVPTPSESIEAQKKADELAKKLEKPSLEARDQARVIFLSYIKGLLEDGQNLETEDMKMLKKYSAEGFEDASKLLDQIIGSN